MSLPFCDRSLPVETPGQRLYLGLAMWANGDWRGRLFAPHGGSDGMLAEYATVFDTVEGNTTFYSGAPRAEIVAAWARQAPRHFRFCFKLPAELTHRRRLVGIVFQAFHLIPTMTALENVAIPLELAGTDDAIPRARDCLEQVGLGGYFRWIIGGDTLPQQKPDPAALLQVMRLAGVDAVQALFVGDSRNDVLAARAAGVPYEKEP